MNEDIPWQDLPRVRAFDFRAVPRWRELPWEARAVYASVRTLLAPLGRLPLRGHAPAVLVAAELDLPLAFVKTALEALQAASWLIVEADALIDPSFVEQERARQSTALRSRMARARRSGRRIVHPGQPVYLMVRAYDDRAYWAVSTRGAGDTIHGKCTTYGAAEGTTGTIDDAHPAAVSDTSATRSDAGDALCSAAARDKVVLDDDTATQCGAAATDVPIISMVDRGEPVTHSAAPDALRVASETGCDADATLSDVPATHGTPTRGRAYTRARLLSSSNLPLFEQIEEEQEEEQEEEKRRNARATTRVAPNTEPASRDQRTAKPKRESKAARRERLWPIFTAHMDAYRAVLPGCDQQRSNSETAWRTWNAAMKRNADDADRVLAQLLGHQWDTWDQRPIFNELRHVLKEDNDRFADWHLHPESRPLGPEGATVYDRHGDRQEQARSAQLADNPHHFVTDLQGGRLDLDEDVVI